ncbi:aldehyde-lyase domain-containing protein [Tanacetum coccineum]
MFQIHNNIVITRKTSDLRCKSRLKNGETLHGLFLLSNSPTLVEIAGQSGYDYVVVDLEHGPDGISDALACLRALAASQKMAKKAVSYCRYPPNGIRGAAHSVVRASGYGIDNGYLSNSEDDLLIMCQVESKEGVKKIKEIAAVDGVDCVQMGPLDLSAGMRYLWDPGNKKVKEMRTAEKGVLKTLGKGKGKDGGGGAYLGGFAMPFDTPEDMRPRGYHMISGAVDIAMFRNAC